MGEDSQRMRGLLEGAARAKEVLPGSSCLTDARRLAHCRAHLQAQLPLCIRGHFRTPWVTSRPPACDCLSVLSSDMHTDASIGSRLDPACDCLSVLSSDMHTDASLDRALET